MPQPSAVPWDLPITQHEAVLQILAQRPATTLEVAARLRIPQGSAAKVMLQLRRRGAVVAEKLAREMNGPGGAPQYRYSIKGGAA